MALQPVLVAVKRIINYLMKNGSASSEELYTKVEVKKRTYYRALKCLLEAKVVIRRDDGFYCWYEYLENVVFTNEVEAEEALKHSRNIARGLESLIGNKKRFFGNEDYLEDKDYCEPAIMHLKTGYPDIYNRVNITVFDEHGQPIQAMTYVKSGQLEETQPSKEYRAVLQQGYRDWGIV